MFPLTREILMYALGILIAMMAVLVVLIFRKRVPLNLPSALSKKKEEESPTSLIEEQSEEGAYTKTGPDDADSIKEKLLGEKKEKPPEPPEKPPIPVPEVQPQPVEAPKHEEKPAPVPKPVQQPLPAPPQPVPEQKHVAPPVPQAPPAAVPEPAPEPTPEEEARAPVFQEGIIEQGVELHDHPEELELEEEGKYGPPHHEPEPVQTPQPEPQPEAVPPQKDAQPQQTPVQQSATPEPSAQHEEYVMLDEIEEESDKHPIKPTAPKIVKEKELVAKGIVKPQEEKGVTARFVPRTQPEDIEALKPRPSVEKPSEFSFKKVENIETGTPVDSATIDNDPKSFIGQTVSIEGDLQLSSKGKDDVWYILFNKTGTSIVMSKEEIPVKRCRLFAKVEKTRMGQIYLNVTRYEEI